MKVICPACGQPGYLYFVHSKMGEFYVVQHWDPATKKQTQHYVGNFSDLPKQVKALAVVDEDRFVQLILDALSYADQNQKASVRAKLLEALGAVKQSVS